jgi:hypothetical protein
MSIFVVLSHTNNSKLEEAIKEKFPSDYYKISPGQWLISTGGTSRELTESIGLIDKEKGLSPAVIFSISSYYGMWSTDLWEWIRVKMEKSNG